MKFKHLLAVSLAVGMSLPAFASEGAQKKRQEIDLRFQWKLSDIYPSDSVWQADWQKALQSGKALAGYQGKLSNPKDLLAFLKAYEKVGITLDKLTQYASMGSDQDTAVSFFNALVGKADTLDREVSAATAFFAPEITAMPPETFKKVIDQPEIAPYRQYLTNIARRAPHTLSRTEEELLANVSEVLSAPESVFKMLNNADMTFPKIKGEKGREVELTKGLYSSLMEVEDREVRKNAYLSFHDTYKKVNNTMAAILNAQVKAQVFKRSARKYPSCLAAALDVDDTPVSVYTSLVQAVDEGLPTLHRYYALRKRIMGLSKLEPYDLSVALVPGSNREYSYPRCVEILQEAIKPLGPEYRKILDQGIAGGWIDVYENKGKRSGAYSWGPYSVHPYVLLNHHGSYRDLSTFAHEMGHAVHRYYAHGNNPFFTANNPTLTAEVASQFNELLLMDYMLKQTKDPKEKLFLLTQLADELIGSVYRQTQYAEFEKTIYDLGDAGETLTSERLNRTWRKISEKYAGPDVQIPALSDVGWSRIPHMYYNFYVYKYSVSYAAALALSERVLKQGTPAAEAYIAFLKAGSSQYPVDLLKSAGVDLTTPTPVRTTLAKFKEVVGEIERLTQEISRERVEKS